jgi:hypothetical protein
MPAPTAPAVLPVGRGIAGACRLRWAWPLLATESGFRLDNASGGGGGGGGDLSPSRAVLEGVRSGLGSSLGQSSP